MTAMSIAFGAMRNRTSVTAGARPPGLGERPRLSQPPAGRDAVLAGELLPPRRQPRARGPQVPRAAAGLRASWAHGPSVIPPMPTTRRGKDSAAAPHGKRNRVLAGQALAPSRPPRVAKQLDAGLAEALDVVPRGAGGPEAQQPRDDPRSVASAGQGRPKDRDAAMLLGKVLADLASLDRRAGSRGPYPRLGVGGRRNPQAGGVVAAHPEPEGRRMGLDHAPHKGRPPRLAPLGRGEAPQRAAVPRLQSDAVGEEARAAPPRAPSPQ